MRGTVRYPYFKKYGGTRRPRIPRKTSLCLTYLILIRDEQDDLCCWCRPSARCRCRIVFYIDNKLCKLLSLHRFIGGQLLANQRRGPYTVP